MVGTCGRYRLISSYFDHFRSFSWDSNRFSWVLLFAPTWILQHAIPLVQSRGCLGCKVSRCQRNLGTCRSWNRFLGHTSTRQDQLSVAGSVASARWVALILKGSHEHPVSCLMCNNMMIYADSAQICKRAVSQKFLSFYDFYVGEQWPQIMCGCIAVCGSTLVFFMPRMILCSKRSVGRHEICFYFISTVRATTEPKFKICNLKNIPSHGQPKGAPPCDWTMKVPDRINELVFETPFFFLNVFFLDVDVPVWWNCII